MKRAALVLVLLTAATQTAIAADCCCVIICRHHSEVCSKCSHEGAVNADPAKTPGKDCCSKTREHAPARSEKRCAHLEPSSEVVQQAADALPLLPALIVDLPLDLSPLGSQARGNPSCTICATGASPPLLHLLHSVLLI